MYLFICTLDEAMTVKRQWTETEGTYKIDTYNSIVRTKGDFIIHLLIFIP